MHASDVMHDPTRCIWAPTGYERGDTIEFKGESYKVVTKCGQAGSTNRSGQEYLYIARITSLEEILLGD